MISDSGKCKYFFFAKFFACDRVTLPSRCLPSPPWGALGQDFKTDTAMLHEGSSSSSTLVLTMWKSTLGRSLNSRRCDDSAAPRRAVGTGDLHQRGHAGRVAR